MEHLKQSPKSSQRNSSIIASIPLPNVSIRIVLVLSFSHKSFISFSLIFSTHVFSQRAKRTSSIIFLGVFGWITIEIYRRCCMFQMSKHDEEDERLPLISSLWYTRFEIYRRDRVKATFKFSARRQRHAHATHVNIHIVLIKMFQPMDRLLIPAARFNNAPH